jgi:hypothetical protein
MEKMSNTMQNAIEEAIAELKPRPIISFMDVLSESDVALLQRYYAQPTWRAIHDKWIAFFKMEGQPDFTACVLASLSRDADGIRKSDQIDQVVSACALKAYSLVGGDVERRNAYSSIDDHISKLPSDYQQQAGKQLRRKLLATKGITDSAMISAINGLMEYMSLSINHWK